MAKNIIYKPGYKLSVACTHPAVPVSGNPVRYGILTGIALTNEGADGKTTVDFGPFVAKFTVHAETGAIAVGDALFYDDAGTAAINNDAVNGFYFGTALGVVASGSAVIEVLHTPSPGAGSLASGSVTTAKLANGAVTFTKAAVFISTEQTGTGSAQNIAHGLGTTPTRVFLAPTDTAPATAGEYTVLEGTHTSTNVVVTVTTGKKFKVLAWA